MLIHAHARKESITVELFDENYVFAAHPENKKAFVCEVVAPEAIERLLAITEGYVEYGQKPVIKAEARVLTATASAADGLTDAERELGFKLDTGEPIEEDTGLSPEAEKFAREQAERDAQEAADEQQAEADRQAALELAAKIDKEAADKAEAEREQRARFVLKSGTETTDLNEMTDADVRAFAKEQGVTGLSKLKDVALREAVVAKLVAA